MVDDDDVSAWVWFVNPTTPVGLVLWLIVLVGLMVVVSGNKEDCAQKVCHAGATPKLMENECLCVERAK